MLLALVSVLGVIGPSATQPLLDNLSTVAPGPAKDILTNVLTSLESNQGGSTVALIIGLAAAIWSASGYIARVHGRVQQRLGRARGPADLEEDPGPARRSPSSCSSCSRSPRWPSSSPARWPRRSATSSASATRSSTVWGIVKWPVLLLIVSFMISLLYWACPNVKQPGFPWVTPGRPARRRPVARRLGAVRALRRELLLLQQDLRQPRRRDRVPHLAVDHEHHHPARRRVQLRDGAQPGDPAAATRRTRSRTCRCATSPRTQALSPRRRARWLLARRRTRRGAAAAR